VAKAMAAAERIGSGGAERIGAGGGGTVLSRTPTQTETACGYVSERREGFVDKTKKE
jgi:hypothetical protein